MCALVKSDIPHHLLAGLKTIFDEEYMTPRPGVGDGMRIATLVPSTKDTEDYAWLGAGPAMREFKDERLPRGLAEYDYTIKNKTWEASIGVDVAALEDEQYGHIKLRIQDMAQRTKAHQDKLIFQLLAAGFTTLCYDGQYFFDTDHSEGDSGTQSNKGTTALGATSLTAGIVAMMKIKDDTGEIMGVIPDLLVVPPDLGPTAWTLLNSVYFPENANMGANYLGPSGWQPKLGLVTSAFLTDTNNWYLLATNRTLKPIVFQERVPVKFDSLEGASETGFMRDKYVYGVRARYNVGYGLWQNAYGAIVT